MCAKIRLVENLSVAAVAQWIEYWPPKPRVVGSIPASRTRYLYRLKTNQHSVIQYAEVAVFYDRNQYAGLAGPLGSEPVILLHQVTKLPLSPVLRA